ncbi:MAG: hypothetical protein KBH45_13285 [Verrucomicrobia bacterium]|nr:hypothetical protein [Verrucomicrobiota bacterium]
MKRYPKKLFFLSTLVAALGLISSTPYCLHATIFTVTTTNNSGPGSLPVIIIQANATPGNNVIQFAVTNAITPGFQLPTITNNVTITGRTDVPTVISGGGILPLFTFAAGTTNSLSNLVLANGYTTSSGAAINNSGTLYVSGCLMTNNFAPGGYGGAVSNASSMTIANTTFQNNRATNGGALFSAGDMTITHCLLSQNQAGNGGAIYNTGTLGLDSVNISNNVAQAGYASSGGGGIYNTGALTISKSIFVGNTATGELSSQSASSGHGGALSSFSGSVGITNSTFYQNTAIGGLGNGYGGAVHVNTGYCALNNCTVTDNLSKLGALGNTNVWAGFAGGIANANGTVLLLNTIVASNSASTHWPDLNGVFVSNGFNLIGNNQGATGLSIFDFQNVAANLGTLQNNGGSTLTCAPLQGSFAIGSGTSIGAPTTDQRGVPRPQGGAFDIGAVQVVTGSPFVAGGAMVSNSGFNLNTIFDATNSYRLQASTNLTTWIDLSTNYSGGSMRFIDTAATNLNHRFYRTSTP